MAFHMMARDGGQPSLAFMGQVVWEDGFLAHPEALLLDHWLALASPLPFLSCIPYPLLPSVTLLIHYLVSLGWGNSSRTHLQTNLRPSL